MSGALDRQAAFTGTREIAPALAFDTRRLAEWMAAHVPGFAGPLRVRQFRGGQSNPTYLVEAASGAYVLRRKPPGRLLPSAHAVEREYRVQRALHAAGFPVPRVHALEEDAGIIGTAFYVMDHVAGRIVWEPHLPGFEPAERAAVYESMNRTLAQLHSFDPEALGLGDFGRPAGYVARQVRRWSEQYRASDPEPLADMERLMEWLPEHLPPAAVAAGDGGRARIVHGDYRIDNLILAPAAFGQAEGGGPEVAAVIDWEVAAVIDWELATLGDPVADFAYHLMKWHMPPGLSASGTATLAGHDLAALGIPSLDSYVRAYEEHTGLSVRPHLDAYLAYNFFRLAAILAGVAARGRAGNAPSELAERMGEAVRPLAETAWRFARQAEQ